MSAHQETAKWILLDWSSLGKRVIRWGGLSNPGFFCKYCEILNTTYFEKHLPTAASVDCKKLYRATESQIQMKYK